MQALLGPAAATARKPSTGRRDGTHHIHPTTSTRRTRGSGPRRPTTAARPGRRRASCWHRRVGQPGRGAGALDVPTSRSTAPPTARHPPGGERTAELIPGAELLVLEDMAHDLPLLLCPRSSTPSPRSSPHQRTSTPHPERLLRKDPMSGPLAGLKIIEIAGIGPGPFTAMMLADMGADVVRIDRARTSAAATRHAAGQRLRPRPALGGRRSQAPRRRRGGALALRARRRPDRGLPPRRHGAARPGPGRCSPATPGSSTGA